jgi:hypothetical protein
MALSGEACPAVSDWAATILRVKAPPTDLQLLRAIYERHRGDYVAAVQQGVHARIAVPIDIPAIAQDLGVNADSVFGRLYHHLDPLYGTQSPDGLRKALFIPQPGEAKDRVNFPLLEAVLAGLWQQRQRDLWTLWIAIVSAAIAIAAIIVSIVFGAAA